MKNSSYIFLLIILILPIQTNKLFAQTGTWNIKEGITDLPDYSRYGTKGIPSSDNFPDRTEGIQSWMDKNGNFWVFGGFGYDSLGHKIHYPNLRNELWKYNLSEGTWTWVHGSPFSVHKNLQEYGTKGVPGPENSPLLPARINGSWTDENGNLWLYEENAVIWMFDTSIEQWIWISGDPQSSGDIIYNEMNVVSESNSPGNRSDAIFWVGNDGNLWLYGGRIREPTKDSFLNDLWKFNITDHTWVWVHGDTLLNQNAIIGLPKTTGPAYKPGGRQSSLTWTDANGNLWLFGGHVVRGWLIYPLNDLWKFDIQKKEWAWMGGDVDGYLYGYQTENWPGSNEQASTWRDSNENIWMFGGYNNSGKILNSVWKYNIPTGQWSLEFNSPENIKSINHIKGQESPENIPGVRSYALGAADSEGNLIVFGGKYGSIAGIVPMVYYKNIIYNELWKYNINTGLWNWLSGSAEIEQKGVYGLKGTESPTNMPGARRNAITFTDKKGNYWLFGGKGWDSNNNEGYLNDLWKYDITSKNWTWIAGSEYAEDNGIMGTKGVPSASNTPGRRAFSATWFDSEGNFWLYGGKSYQRSGMSDMWKFDLTTYQWTWINGADDHDQIVEAVRSEMGVADPNNHPGSRSGMMSWVGSDNNFYFFGGGSYSSLYSDIWRFSPATGLWTWVSGSDASNEESYVGTKGITSELNTPGGRYSAAYWTDKNGDLWLLGGHNTIYGFKSPNIINDLWRYDISLNQWAWEGGYNPGVYGTRGKYNPDNWPAARGIPHFWKDSKGDFWLFGGGDLRFTFINGTFPREPTNLRNDLWTFNVDKKQWVWVSGSESIYQPINADGFVGSGGRFGAAIWQSLDEKVIVYGGIGYDESNYLHYLRDFWELAPCGSVPEVAGSGIDENCDDLYLWYKDEDGDGEGGSLIVSSPNYIPGVGESDNDLDCDDNDPEINSKTIWYVDNDGDGYGDVAGQPIVQCNPLAGYVNNNEDCFDGSSDWNNMVDPPLPKINVLELKPGYILLESDFAEGNQWYKDSELMKGETGQQLKSNHAGIYMLKVTQYSCESPHSYPVLFNKSPQYFPNPVADELNIVLAAENIGSEVIVYIHEPTGKLIYSYTDVVTEAPIVLDVNHLKPGIYLITVKTKLSTETFRINKI
ncbi:MAG: T9SS type A sorting domain-containing protein [Cyclobacteriaceae bacterium]|nr:T9SS type A sorting domain-containing protein [Cyclobacteriaceae bacterium]